MEEQRRKLHSSSGVGSYVWSDEDLHNALLWFRDDHHDYDGQLNLVDSLLKSPGIITDRPMEMKMKTNSSSKNNRKRQRVEDEGGMEMEMNRPCRPLLPSVISELLSTWVDKDDALQHLKVTLQTIASKRYNTKDAYNTRLQHWVEKELPTLIAGDQEKALQIYLKHPRTIVKMTYAEQLYDQYLHLKRTEEECSSDNNHNGDNGDNKAKTKTGFEIGMKKFKSMILLEKLCSLSNLQSDVAEALLLMTLVPLKRRYCEGTRVVEEGDENHGHHDWTMKITEYLKPNSSVDLQRSIPDHDVHGNKFKFEKEALDQLVELIPQKTEFCTSTTSTGTSGHSTMSTIANLDASLLSSVSKLHFPIAEHIIRSLAKCAVECHDSIQATSSLSLERDEDVGGGSDRDNKSCPSSCYDDCVNSLVQLGNASEVLKSLCRQILVRCDGDEVMNNEQQNTQAWKILETDVLSRE